MTSTAIDHGHGVKKSTGFSIASLIGKESEKNDSGAHRRNVDSCIIRSTSPISKRENVRTPTREKRELPQNHHQEPRKEVTFGSLHDSISRHHSDFSPARRDRDSFSGHHSASESLKHLHEVLSQTSGGTGTYFSPRLCRHPLSALNLHSMYHSQLPPSTPLHPLVINSARDIRHLNPWISDRYPGYYYPRYPATPGFLFQPYRKPKRIRTAFSPSQLLQLEKAFEKSHYVVGQERKDLAAELQLTETQVKVWFQNRRTKHKRMKAEDGEGPSSPENSTSKFTGSDVDCKEGESDLSDIDDISDTEHEMMMQQLPPS